MKRFPRRRQRKSPRIEIIPMVDVMFLLLVFYVLSSLALTQKRGITVQPPSAQSGEPAKVSQLMIVSVNAAGEVFLDSDPVAAEQLGERIEEKCQTRPGGIEAVRAQGVIVNADRASVLRSTVQVMDELRQVGIYNFAISTDTGARP